MSLIVTNHHASVHLGSSDTGSKHPNTSNFVLKYINGVMGQLILLSKKEIRTMEVSRSLKSLQCKHVALRSLPRASVLLRDSNVSSGETEIYKFIVLPPYPSG